MSHLILLHLDGADQSTTITNDGSDGDSFTAFGTAELDTAQKEFGSASLLLDGNSDYVEATGVAALPSSGTGWCIDGRFRFNVLNQDMTLFDYNNGVATQVGVSLRWFTASQKLELRLSSNGTTSDIFDGLLTKASWNADQWYHIVLVRDNSAGSYFAYVDGTEEVEVSSGSQITSSVDEFRVGLKNGGSRYWNGWIDEINVEDDVRYPGGTSFTPPTAAYVPSNDGTAAVTLPLKTIFDGLNPASAAITLPTKIAIGYFNGSAITLPSKTVAATGTLGAVGNIVLPLKTVDGLGSLIFSASLNAELPELTSSFEAWVGGSMSISVQDPWLDFESTALLGSLATFDATPKPVSSSFQAVQGPFGLDVTLPVMQASMSATVGIVGTLDVQLPQIVLRFTGEGTYSATLAARATLPLAAFTALRGASASVTMTLPLPKAAMVAEFVTEADIALVFPLVTSAFSGYTQASVTFAMTTAVPVAAFIADSQYVFDRTLVMNTVSHAVSEYASYAFNSFCEFNGAYYAADSNGVFLLDTGDVDDGSVEIPANLTTGDLDFENEFQKRIPDIYLALHAAGDMTVSVSMDEQTTYQYTLTTHGVSRLKQRRVKIGKGIKGKYCRVGVANVSGADFDLDTLNITATQSKIRRI